ncbi:AsmA family protein [Bradyrhizobium sp.]|uniref:AsmA family protein n=1 Tax=Bradyrhizobium sp. TaxID=376 RepID=UPI0025BC4F2F|nr:AsmA family protein [Bradyrhizobium sp.]MBV8921974.1 AsmA family protein [Bradyrhizobium sp.]
MQTTLLGLAIAFIIALLAALIGPYFVDWNQFRPQFEAEATKILGMKVRVSGRLDARLLPTPTLRLRSVTLGGANDFGRVRADRLDVEFSLGSLMRGEWRANELTIGGMALDLGLDQRGRIDWPAATGTFDLASLSIDRLNLTGRVALHDAASRRTLELDDIAFSGDVRSLAGSLRGDGNVTINGTRYPFRVASGQTPDGGGVRLHLGIDSTDRTPATDLDGLLSFVERVPHFDGAIALSVAVVPEAKDNDAQKPWRISAKVKADPGAAHLEQVEASYGADDRALRIAGTGDVRFGASPQLRATLSARQLDADRLFSREGAKENKDSANKDATDNSKDSATRKDVVEPQRWGSGLRALVAALPSPPMATQVEFGAEQIMLGGRPLQNITATVRGDAAGWKLDWLDVRGPGGTHVAFTNSLIAPPDSLLSGTLDIDSADPDVLVSWLQGRGEGAARNQKPLRFRGDFRVSSDRIAIEAVKAEIDGGTVEGRLALLHPASAGSRFEATLRADRLDLDAATAFVRALAGPTPDWPDEAQLSLDLGRAVWSGQELRPFAARLGYTPKALSLDQLKFGQPNGVAMEATGRFDRGEATGRLALSASAASLNQVNAWLAPVAPALVSRLEAVGTGTGPARLKLTLDAGRSSDSADRTNLRAVVDLDSAQLKGTTTLSAKPRSASLRGFDLADIGRNEISLETHLSAERGATLFTLMGIDHMIAGGDGPAQLEGTASGAWHAPQRISVKMWGAGVDADIQGTAEPWADPAKANVGLRVRSVNLAPLFGLKTAEAAAQNIRLFSHVSLLGNKLTFEDLDSIAAGSRLRGHLALSLGEEKQVDGEVGLDTLDLAPVFGLAIGAAGRDAGEPLAGGLMKGWRGKVAFQSLRGTLPGGIELRPVGGTLTGDGQSLVLDNVKAGIAGGEMTASLDARPGANGISLNARLELANADGAALRYRALKMPAGRVSGQMTLTTQGRSASALTGALSASGVVTLNSTSIAGLDPHAFETAIRASDAGQVTDDNRLRQIVDPALSGGSLSVASAQIPFTIRDGRLRVGATTLEAEGARVIVSGGYDIPADQVDIRASLASTEIGSDKSRPEIQLFAVGSPDGLSRTLDVTSLSSWLAVRVIDRETRRLDQIERGENPAPQPMSAPPSNPALPPPVTSAVPGPVVQPEAPLGDVAAPGRAPYRPQPKPKAAVPRAPDVSAAAGPNVSEQIAPLPPPIEIRPAPNPLLAKPKPRPPMVLVPQAINP